MNFTDTSTGPVTSWSWDFGDGGISTAQNPVHTYTAAGTYTVELTVEGPGGTAVETKANYVVVTDPPSVKLERGVVSGVGSSWVTVDLENLDDSMVVIGTPNYSSSDPPAVVRIRSAAGTAVASFSK